MVASTIAGWLESIEPLIKKAKNLESEHYTLFLQNPGLAIELIDLINEMSEQVEPDEKWYTIYLSALDVSVSQLQSSSESGNKLAKKKLDQLMTKISEIIASGSHSLSFWLPILNAFYEADLELSPELKDAYFELASKEEFVVEEDDHLEAIREMIDELSDLSAFEIAENFFAQSYAMPVDFFADLILDLYSIEQGHDIALLTLLHPKQEVRDIAIMVFDQLIDQIKLSSISLSRLQAIKNWYPSHEEQFNHWIRKQRKKGVVFSNEPPATIIEIKASDVDGQGMQGLLLRIKKEGKNRLCGLLFKQHWGIKDAWITPVISLKEMSNYYSETSNNKSIFRKVNYDYLLMITEHFLALTLQQGNIPDLHLLEIQELLGIQFYPRALNISNLIEQLGVKIIPFTPEVMRLSLKRSKLWLKNKYFAESWYGESAVIDKLVNRCCSFIDGVKVCALEKAMSSVFSEVFEKQRADWIFHFLWISLWANSKARKNEKIGLDSFFIAYAIYSGMLLKDIPVMEEICRQTVIHSIETMSERGTYINRE